MSYADICAFRIADPDTFEVANFNRQYGADTETVGQGKAETMAQKARVLLIAALTRTQEPGELRDYFQR